MTDEGCTESQEEAWERYSEVVEAYVRRYSGELVLEESTIREGVIVNLLVNHLFSIPEEGRRAVNQIMEALLRFLTGKSFQTSEEVADAHAQFSQHIGWVATDDPREIDTFWGSDG